MIRRHSFTSILIALTFLLTACAGGEESPVNEQPAAAPEIRAFDPAVLEAGTSMPWYDGNELVYVPAVSSSWVGRTEARNTRCR